MRQIISFLIINKFFLLFLLLEIIAISLTIQNHSFHRSKFINSSKSITGSIYNNFNSLKEYTHLKEFNKQLSNENVRLKNLISQQNKTTDVVVFNKIDSLIYNNKYQYINAKIIKNDYTKYNNFLTINKGNNDNISSEMGVVTSKGIVGVTNNTSSKFSTVISVLNENSKINAKLLKNHHFGTLVWNSLDYKTVQLLDIPRQANLKIGDTIITGGKSTIFPEGILIGKIKDFNLENNNYQIVNVTLFNDMSALKHINIIVNLDKKEIIELESKNE